MPSGQTINKYLDQSQWRKARSLILRELKREPDSHWLITRLGSTYYEERLYRKSLTITARALRRAPSCPLVLWDYAWSLDMVGRHKAAIDVWRKILKMGLAQVAHGEHGEGLRWGRSLLNDCRYRIGVSYHKLRRLQSARKYIKQHLKHRSARSSYSIYTLAEVKKHLARIETAMERT